MVKCIECSRNLEFEKRTDQNIIPQNPRHGQEHCISKKKKMYKGGYIWIYIGFCGVVVHFLANGR